MPQKSSSILFTLLSSVFMMMLVASLFHLPTGRTLGGVASSLLGTPREGGIISLHTTPQAINYERKNGDTIHYLPRQ